MKLFTIPPLEIRLDETMKQLESVIKENNITTQQLMHCAELLHNKYCGLAKIVEIDFDK